MSRRRKKVRRANATASAPLPPPAPQKPLFGDFFTKVATSAKRATTQVLDAVEKDPERALAGVGHVLSESEKLINKVRTAPPESRRALRNEIVSIVAKGIKKAIEEA